MNKLFGFFRSTSIQGGNSTRHSKKCATFAAMQERQQNEWFATWFDSPYYHVLYDNRNEVEAQRFIERLCAHLGLVDGTRVLDLACGSGRHARVLHALGFNVTGADLSPNNIQLARDHAPDGLTFILHDMRDPLPDTYDVVMNLFTSFGYFDTISDNAKALESVHAALSPDGLLVIDFMNADKVIRELKTRQELRKSNILFHIKKEVVNGRIVKTIAFEADGHSYFFQEKVQALDLVDFQQLLGNAGFSIQAVYGNYQLEPFNELNSERLILICKKV